MHIIPATQRITGRKTAVVARGFLRHALLFTFLVPALSLSPVRCAAQDARLTYTVSGIVENSLTHQPISRALVEADSDAVLTDSEGRFELHLPAGMSNLIARRPGYQGDSSFQRGNLRLINVTEGMAPVTITLTPDATLSGQVTLSGGDDPADIQLALYGRRVLNGHSRWMQMGNTNTGSDGTFHMQLPNAPGPYVLCAMPSLDRAPQTSQAEIVWGYAPACYPGGTDPATAITAPLSVSSGQQAQLEISLERQPFYPVSISISNGKENPSVFPQVFDRSGRPMELAARRDQQSESTQYYLPSGSYYAEVRSGGSPRGGAKLYGRRDFTVAGAPLSSITVAPTPVPTIPVEVHEEFTANPAPGQGAVFGDGFPRDQPQVQISLTPVDRPFDGGMGMGVELKRVQGSSEGIYEMNPPQQGTYRLDIQPFGPYYAASVTSGGTDLLQEPLVIGLGNAAQPIEITLRDDMGFLECTAKTAPSDSSASNSTTPEFAPIFVSAISLGSGQHRVYKEVIQLPNRGKVPLPPGNYLVLAFEKDREIDLDDADAFSGLSSHGQTVTIQPSATANLQVDPIRSTDEGTGQ
jgi:hypothetical protein